MPYKDPEKKRTHDKEYYENHRAKKMAYSKEYHEKHRERMVACCREYYKNHKKELVVQNKKYRKNHREEIAAKAKEYQENHREKIAACRREYYENHREEAAAYSKNHREELSAYQKKRMSTPEGKIIAILRTRLRNALKGELRAAPTLKLLGCSIKYFLLYIEKQFKPGMAWDNHAKFGWHLDHIKPIASFNMLDLEQQRACFHYSNLQPLWWQENLIKNGKLFS